jgi:hypothetical protein
MEVDVLHQLNHVHHTKEIMIFVQDLWDPVEIQNVGVNQLHQQQVNVEIEYVQINYLHQIQNVHHLFLLLMLLNLIVYRMAQNVFQHQHNAKTLLVLLILVQHLRLLINLVKQLHKQQVEEVVL